MQHTSISAVAPARAPCLARAGVALALGFAVAACGKVPDSDQGTPSAPGTGNAGSNGMGTSSGFEEMPVTVLECIPGRLPRRAVWLSQLQFAHAVTRLLGPAALDAEQVPDASLKPFSQNGVVVDLSLLQTRLDLAGRASASLEGRVAEVTGCVARDDACARACIATLAAHAFRRPVLEAEIADLNAVYDAGRETDLFGTLLPGGANDQATLLRARRQRKSVLDFMQRDHARLRQLAPASQREQLDMHAAAIREMELAFDAVPGDLASCAVPAAPEVLSVSTELTSYGGNGVAAQRDDETHARIGALHMAVIKAAFRCDLTRVVTFQWAPGNNHVSFGGLWPRPSACQASC